MCYRFIGFGVQGFVDVFFVLCMFFELVEVCELNKQIFEIIYYVVLIMLCQFVKEQGIYFIYEGFFVFKGIFQYDMWNVKFSDFWDWDEFKVEIKKNGVCNLLLVVFMLMVFIFQILGNNECFEFYIFNIYQCCVFVGEF